MASTIDLRDGKLVIIEGTKEVARLTTPDLLLARNGNDITAKFKLPPGVRKRVYHFKYNALGGGWECSTGPRGTI